MGNIEIKKIQIAGNKGINISLSNNEELIIPKNYTNRLNKASFSQFNNFRILPDRVGIHWPDIDEDISIVPLLKTKRRFIGATQGRGLFYPKIISSLENSINKENKLKYKSR